MSFKHREKKVLLPASETSYKKDIFAYVATPAYDGRVLTDYAISIAESVQAATVLGIRVATTVMGNGAFIDLSRNTFVRMFLDSKCTHLFFIDADLRWEPYAFVNLLMADKPLVAGAYPKRQSPEEYPAIYADDPDGGGVWAINGWIQCDRVATGFMCIERSVIETMWDKRPVQKLQGQPEQRKLFYTKDTPEGAFIGEDYAFCDDYRTIFNKKVEVWPDFNFTHGVTYKGNWHEFLLRAPVEEDPNKGKILPSPNVDAVEGPVYG